MALKSGIFSNNSIFTYHETPTGATRILEGGDVRILGTASLDLDGSTFCASTHDFDPDTQHFKLRCDGFFVPLLFLAGFVDIPRNWVDDNCFLDSNATSLYTFNQASTLCFCSSGSSGSSGTRVATFAPTTAVPKNSFAIALSAQSDVFPSAVTSQLNAATASVTLSHPSKSADVNFDFSSRDLAEVAFPDSLFCSDCFYAVRLEFPVSLISSFGSCFAIQVDSTPATFSAAESSANIAVHEQDWEWTTLRYQVFFFFNSEKKSLLFCS